LSWSGDDPEAVDERLGHLSAAFFLERHVKAIGHARERDAGIMNALFEKAQTVEVDPASQG